MAIASLGPFIRPDMLLFSVCIVAAVFIVELHSGRWRRVRLASWFVGPLALGELARWAEEALGAGDVEDERGGVDRLLVTLPTLLRPLMMSHHQEQVSLLWREAAAASGVGGR